MRSTYPNARVTADRAQYVKTWVERKVVNGTEMPMIVANNLVVFEIPAFDLFVLAAGEQVRVTVTDYSASDLTYVPCKGNF